MDDEALLKAYDIKPTAIRLLIIKNIRQFSSTFSFDELYQYLETVDRSTVFRTVTLFEKQRLLYGFDDGMGKHKYCFTQDETAAGVSHVHTIGNHHVHLSCRVCGRTYCLPSEMTPHIHVPSDFEVEDVNCIVTGVCSNCKTTS